MDWNKIGAISGLATTVLTAGDPMHDRYTYFDPVAALPAAGQAYWAQRQRNSGLIMLNQSPREQP